MTKQMRAHRFGNARALRGFTARLPDYLRGDWFVRS
jgi:hypothetical protein